MATSIADIRGLSSDRQRGRAPAQGLFGLTAAGMKAIFGDKADALSVPPQAAQAAASRRAGGDPA